MKKLLAATLHRKLFQFQLASSVLLAGLLGTTASSHALELYSWEIAQVFCELRSYGVERQEAIVTAVKITMRDNPFMQVNFMNDTTVKLNESESLAVARIRRQAEEYCPKLAEKSESAANSAADESGTTTTPP